MSDMLDFCVSLLGKIAEFLMMEPIIYIVGMILCAIVFKIFFEIIKISRA